MSLLINFFYEMTRDKAISIRSFDWLIARSRNHSSDKKEAAEAAPFPIICTDRPVVEPG